MDVLDRVSRHKWPGCLLHAGGCHAADIDFHFQAAWRTFHANRWILTDRHVFFFLSFLFLQPSLVQTVLLVSVQAYEEHEGQKSSAHAGAYGSGGSRLQGGGSVGASARIWLQLG